MRSVRSSSLSLPEGARRNEGGERKERGEKRRRGREAWAESREGNTAGGTRRREVLLSSRGPLSSLSRWWQVSVAALAAVDGRHRRQGRFLSQSPLVRAAKPLRGVACPPRARRVCARRRRQATRTMRDPTPRVTPPPRSDATATRYAPRTRCWKRVREPLPFCFFVERRDCGGRIIAPRGEPFRQSGTLFASSVEGACYLGGC